MNVGTGGYGRAVATGIAPADRSARHESLGAGLRRVPPLVPALAVVFAVTVAVGWSVVHLLDSVAAWDTDVIENLASRRTSRLNSLTGYGTWLADSVTSIVLVLVAIVVARIVTKAVDLVDLPRTGAREREAHLPGVEHHRRPGSPAGPHHRRDLRHGQLPLGTRRHRHGALRRHRRDDRRHHRP